MADIEKHGTGSGLEGRTVSASVKVNSKQMLITEYAVPIISSKQHANWSFVAIAFESGFNSKTAFSVFFKK